MTRPRPLNNRTKSASETAYGVLFAAQVVLCSFITERGWPPVSWGAEPRPWRVSPLNPPPRRRPLLPSAPSRTRWCVSESSTRLSFFPRVVACSTYMMGHWRAVFPVHTGAQAFWPRGERKKKTPREHRQALSVSMSFSLSARAAYARMQYLQAWHAATRILALGL